MAYMCVFNHKHECDGCGECEEERMSKKEWLWEKQEEEYDNYRDREYEEHERYTESEE